MIHPCCLYLVRTKHIKTEMLLNYDSPSLSEMTSILKYCKLLLIFTNSRIWTWYKHFGKTFFYICNFSECFFIKNIYGCWIVVVQCLCSWCVCVFMFTAGSFCGASACPARLRRSTGWWRLLHRDTVTAILESTRAQVLHANIIAVSVTSLLVRNAHRTV